MAGENRPRGDERFSDLSEDPELNGLFDEDHPKHSVEECPGCAGKGKYVGFREIEDPCQVCGGTGWISLSAAKRRRRRQRQR